MAEWYSSLKTARRLRLSYKARPLFLTFCTLSFAKMHTPPKKCTPPPIFCTPLYKSLSEGIRQGKITRIKGVFFVSADPYAFAVSTEKCRKSLFQAVYGHKIKTLMLISTVSKLAFLYGGPEGIRTHDLSDANRTLSQLSYRPKY